MSINNLFKENDYKLYMNQLITEGGQGTVEYAVIPFGAGIAEGAESNVAYYKDGNNITITFSEIQGAKVGNDFIEGAIDIKYAPENALREKIIVYDNSALADGVVLLDQTGIISIRLNFDSLFTGSNIGFAGFSLSFVQKVS